MGRITAMGCAGAALVAAARAVEHDAFVATVAALAAFGVAGELAAQRARGPGSFVPAIVDALFALDGATLRAKARVA
jgi:hydroxyethylthiazole kinase